MTGMVPLRARSACTKFPEGAGEAIGAWRARVAPLVVGVLLCMTSPVAAQTLSPRFAGTWRSNDHGVTDTVTFALHGRTLLTQSRMVMGGTLIVKMGRGVMDSHGGITMETHRKFFSRNSKTVEIDRSRGTISKDGRTLTLVGKTEGVSLKSTWTVAPDGGRVTVQADGVRFVYIRLPARKKTQRAGNELSSHSGPGGRGRLRVP